MKGWMVGIALMIVAGVLLSVSSCGRDQQLVSIEVQPAVETFGASNIPVAANAGLQVQLKALGTYIHPPVTKDITNQVTWTSNTPQMVTASSTGLITATGNSCGGTLVSATFKTNTSAGGLSSSGAIVTGTMTANVICFSGNGGGTNPALTVTFNGAGFGTVTSSPAGLALPCTAPTPCIGQFGANTTVTVTATPSGASTFGNWAGCDSQASINPCSVTMTGNRTVTVTFN